MQSCAARWDDLGMKKWDSLILTNDTAGITQPPPIISLDMDDYFAIYFI